MLLQTAKLPLYLAVRQKYKDMESAMSQKSFQDQDSVLNCYGCGANNSEGNQLKSFWDGDEAVAEFQPKPHHCAGSPEIVYGGLIASLIDCHSCNLAVAHSYKLEKRPIGSDPRILCVTAQLNISLLKPSPISETLSLRARIREIDRRKFWIDCEVQSGGKTTAKGEVLAIRLKDSHSA